jgi:hypothetical protein
MKFTLNSIAYARTTTALIASFVMVLAQFSCRKVESKPEVNLKSALGSVRNPGGYPCEDYNLCRLMDLVNGGGMSSSLQCEAFPPPIVYNGILTFGSRNSLAAYLVGLDSLTSKWSYSVGDETLETVGNDALNAVDNYYGINSLRKKLDVSEFVGFEDLDSLSSSIVDPDLENILNDKLELIVGDTIYKYVTSGHIAVIPSRDMAGLESVRNRGLFSVFPGIIYYNESQGVSYANYSENLNSTSGLNSSLNSKLGPSISTLTSSGCGNVQLSARAELGNFWNDCRLITNLWSGPGDCGNVREYSIDWGDGVVETYQPCQMITGSSLCNWVTQACQKYHAYNPSLIPPGGFRDFEIKVYAKYRNIGCDPSLIGQVYYKAVTYRQYAQNDCRKQKYEKSISDPTMTFSYNGGTYRVRGKMGQNPKPFLTSIPGVNPKVWAEVISERFQNGKWIKTTPILNNYVKLSGHYFSNCTSVTPFGTSSKLIYTGQSKSFRRKAFISLNSGTSTLNDFQFMCDVETRYISGNSGRQNVKLW